MKMILLIEIGYMSPTMFAVMKSASIKLFIMLMYINLGGNQLLKSVKSSAKFPLQLAILYYAS